MKKLMIKVIALSLAAFMLMAVMCGCGGKSMKIKVGVKLGQDYIDFKYAEAKSKGDEDFIIPADERTILDNLEVTINYDEDDPVTALRALRDACENNSIDFTMNSAGRVEKIRTYSTLSYTPDANNPIEGYDEPLSFIWAFTVNGEEPAGRVNTYEVKEGDVLVFTLSAGTEEAE